MKNVLLLVHDDDGQEARLQAALDLVRVLQGHLICLDVLMVPSILATYDPYAASAAADMMADVNEQDSANRSRLEARLAHEDVTWDWRNAIDTPAAAIEAESKLADIIVLSSGIEDYDPSMLRRLVGRVTERSGRPVLAVPKDARGVDVNGTVLIAWDGSREANEALRDAVPLLTLADNVILMDLDEGQGTFAPSVAASYLSRHGIHARIELAQRKPGATIYSSILDRAHEVGASYIVMGAFGHSTTTEAIFGGVTRSMLAQSKLPLFLAH